MEAHDTNGDGFIDFEEPIFAFLPSIGIGRLAEIPNEFSNKIKNNYFVCSLNRRSIFRVRFNDEFNKIIFNIYANLKLRHYRELVVLSIDQSMIDKCMIQNSYFS